MYTLRPPNASDAGPPVKAWTKVAFQPQLALVEGDGFGPGNVRRLQC